MTPKSRPMAQPEQPIEDRLSPDDERRVRAGIEACPAPSDFRKTTGEGSCGYSVCGPLVPGVGVDLADGGSGLAGQGTGSCCFWVLSACGV